MPSSTSPSMGLFLPIPGSTPGPQWASETTTNWSTLDTHDHTAGKGVQIPIAALNVNADFSWLTFGQTNVGYLSLVDKLATGNLTVNASLGNVAGDPYWRNAAGVVKKIGLAGDQLASGTALLGSLLMTAIAAPGSPTAGFGSLYFDSTATNIAVKTSAGVVKHGVQTKAAVASNWITSIADDGSSVLARPAATDISDATTAGKAMLTAASATAQTALLDLATTTVKGLMPAASMVQLNYLPVLIDDVTVSAVSTYTTAAWTANAYGKIIIEFYGTYNGYLTLQANADATAGNYLDCGLDILGNSTTLADSTFHTQGSARTGIVSNATNFVGVAIDFFPVTTGRGRPGLSRSHSTSSTAGTCVHRTASFSWENTATDITFLTFGATGATITGRFRVWGV